MLKLFATQEEKEILIEALGNYGKPLLEEKKPSRETKKKIASIEKLIHQIHFGRDQGSCLKSYILLGGLPIRPTPKLKS